MLLRELPKHLAWIVSTYILETLWFAWPRVTSGTGGSMSTLWSPYTIDDFMWFSLLPLLLVRSANMGL